MKRLVEFPLEGGGSFLVEVDEPSSPGGITRAARTDGIPEKAKQTFEAGLDKVRSMASVLLEKLRALADSPDEVEVEFGVKMNSEMGAIIAKAGVEAHYRVTLKWKRAADGK